jgi:glycosyltransferase involved in cell wall biosynthesis
MARQIDKESIVHARGNLAAIAAMIRNPHNWIWDCRSMHADQRLALSEGKLNKIIYFGMRIFESLLARFSSRIIVITNSVKKVFEERYSISSGKMLMISTCVDTAKFLKKPLPENETIRILLSGTFSPAYDLTLITKILEEMKKRSEVHVTVAASLGATSSWNSIPYDEYLSVPHDQMSGLIENSHCGFSIWRNDLGVCLRSVASTKTAEFLAMGRPVFINSKQGDFQNLFKDYKIGVVTDSQDDASVSKYVDQMFSLLCDLSTTRNCRKLAEENFSLDEGVSNLLKLYSSLD